LTGNHKIKAVVFDLGGVLVDFDHGIAARRISAFCSKTPQEIFDLFFDSEITGLFEEGKIPPRDFFQRVKEMLGANLDYEGFLPIWNEIFFLTEKNNSVYDLTKVLRKRYRIALLSNINVLHFDYLKSTFPQIFDTFHHIIASYETGFKKPQTQIYKRTFEILGVSPEEIFYTDDRPELIQSAQGLGVSGFVFKNIPQLKADLLSVGINTD